MEDIPRSLRPSRKQRRPKMERYTRKDFDRDFPDDEACLNWLFRVNNPDGTCPVCKKATEHYRVKGRAAFVCDVCLHQSYPMVGTIYEKSSTSHRTWFLSIFLMSTTRTGISAKWLERQTGVTYKTAWRMFKNIRAMLDEGKPMFGGGGQRVEIDETIVGGYRRMDRDPRGNKSVVLGIHERGGRMYGEVIPDQRKRTLVPLIQHYVTEGTTIYTDELLSYRMLRREGYPEHYAVNHKRKVFAVGEAHVNNVESFWGNFKRGVDGAHHRLSPKYLQTYIDEWTFRYNHRNDAMPLFWTMLAKASG